MSSENNTEAGQTLEERIEGQVNDIITDDKPVKWQPEDPVVYQKANEGIKRIRQRAFLEAFAKNGSIGKSCEIAGINRSTEMAWRRKDPWYQKYYADALEEFKETIDAEIYHRAIEGEQVDIYGKVQHPLGLGPEDKVVGSKRVKSDLLLMFMAKRHIPEYKDKFEPQKEDAAKVEVVSPFTRITVRIEEMKRRASLAPGEIEGKVNQISGQTSAGPSIIDVEAEPVIKQDNAQ